MAPVTPTAVLSRTAERTPQRYLKNFSTHRKTLRGLLQGLSGEGIINSGECCV
jgi:hypothetical protein